MQKSGFLYILASSVLWGTTGTAQALAPEGAQSLAIGTLRLIVGGIALLGAALVQQVVIPKKGSIPTQTHQRLPFGPVLIAAACMAAYQVLFFYGVARAGVAIGTIVGIGSSPVIAGALGYLFRGEKPGWRWGAATLLAIAGCGLLALSGPETGLSGTTGADPLGIMMAIGAGAAYATFSLVSKGLLERQPVQNVMAPVFCLGALMLSPLLLTQDLTWLFTAQGLGVILHLGLLATALAYTLFGRGLALVPLAAAVTLSLAEPLTAGTLGVLLLGERLTLQAGVGILLIFSGLLVLSVKGIRTSHAAEQV